MIYKRGKVYWHQFQIDGWRIRESAKTTNKAVALKAEADKRVFLVKGGRPSPPNSNLVIREFVEKEFLTWSQAQNKRNTHKRYRVSSKPLTGFFGRMRLDEMTTSDIEQFKLKRLQFPGWRQQRPSRSALHAQSRSEERISERESL